MPVSNESKISDTVLLTLKFVLELFSQTINKSEGLEFIERRIKRVKQKWENQRDILEPLICLLQVLDIAIEIPENIEHTQMLSKSINMVLWIFQLLGATQIKVKENDVFNPRFHRPLMFLSSDHLFLKKVFYK